MQTYRHDSMREDRRRLTLRRHEALVRARQRFGEACSALSYGQALHPGANEAPGTFLPRLILARRMARTSAAAIVIAVDAALGGIAILSPGLPALLLPLTWIAGIALYAGAEALILRVGEERLSRILSPDADAATLRAEARGLEITSALLPALGFLLTVILPIAWLSMAGGGATLLFLLAVTSYVFFSWLRGSMIAERAQLTGQLPPKMLA